MAILYIAIRKLKGRSHEIEITYYFSLVCTVLSPIGMMVKKSIFLDVRD